MTTQEFESMVHFIAQGAVNITEGHTTVQRGSAIHKAMERFCEAVNREEIVLRGERRFDSATGEPLGGDIGCYLMPSVLSTQCEVCRGSGVTMDPNDGDREVLCAECAVPVLTKT